MGRLYLPDTIPQYAIKTDSEGWVTLQIWFFIAHRPALGRGAEEKKTEGRYDSTFQIPERYTKEGKDLFSIIPECRTHKNAL